MEAVEELVAWAADKGIKMNGIRPMPLPGRGIGIISTRRLKQGETLLEVPTSCLKCLDTVKYISRRLPKETSVHCRLALDLCLDTSPDFETWKAVMPQPEDFVNMPLLWPEALQQKLPFKAKDLLTKQKAKVERDWAVASKAFPMVARHDFVHAWLLVNSRTFYHVTSKTQQMPPDDRMALQPVADLFNHTASGGCKVTFDDSGFAVAAERDYSVGDEVLISYGRHSNDFLLVEYGFYLAQNEWDEVGLDEHLLKQLKPRQKELLEERAYLGGYFVDARTVCYKTEVAAQMLCLSMREWLRLVDSGEDLEDDPMMQEQVEKVISGLLHDALREAERVIGDFRHVRAGSKMQRDALKGRWVQVRDLLAGVLEARMEEE